MALLLRCGKERGIHIEYVYGEIEGESAEEGEGEESTRWVCLFFFFVLVVRENMVWRKGARKPRCVAFRSIWM